MAYTANVFGFVFAAMGFTLKSMMEHCCFLSVTVTAGISFFLGLRLKHLNHNTPIHTLVVCNGGLLNKRERRIWRGNLLESF